MSNRRVMRSSCVLNKLLVATAFAVSLVFFPISSMAQDETGSGKMPRNMVAMEGALTSDYTWSWELSYRYRLLGFLSAGASVGYWKQWTDETEPSGDEWIVDDDSRKIDNFYLRPNVMLVTPKLLGIKDWRFSLYANPGVMMNIPYGSATIDVLAFDGNVGHVAEYKKVSTHNGDWAAFDCRFGLSIGQDDASILIGYQFSTLDIYGMHRNLSYLGHSFNDFYPAKKLQHSFVLEVNISF